MSRDNTVTVISLKGAMFVVIVVIIAKLITMQNIITIIIIEIIPIRTTI